MSAPAHPPIFLFDMDGVLLSTKSTIMLIRGLLKDPRLHVSPVKLKSLSVMNTIRYFESLERTHVFEMLRKVNRYFQPIIPHFRHRLLFLGRLAANARKFELIYGDLYPGVHDLIKRLAAKGFILGIATNSERPRIKRWLKKTGLTNEIPFIVSRSEKSLYGLKPNPHPLLGILRDMKYHYDFSRIDRKQVFFIGDNVTDIQAANRANVIPIATLNGHGRLKELYEAKPRYFLKSVIDIEHILESLTRGTPQDESLISA